MVNQDFRPVRWIIVDDGSEDETPIQAESAAREHDWIEVIRRSDRGYRLPGQGVVDAFYEGFDAIGNCNWDFISKFDGDLSFGKDYFSKCLSSFAEDPQLGIAGGMCSLQRGGQIIPETPDDPIFHVRGPTKIYRRQCFEQIGGLKRLAGWDGIDELKANMLGWTTKTLRHIPIIHHRPTGQADGTWKNQVKFGRANYIMGYHPLFMVAKILKRLFQPPFVVGSLGLGWGYLAAIMNRVPTVDDPELIGYVRQEQLNKLLLRPSIW